MQIESTTFKGVYLLKPKLFFDSRGYFFESYNSKRLNEFGLDYKFVQDNESMSDRGVLRGFHYQIGDFAQTKLIRVIKGSVLDVIVDIRPDSETYGMHYKVVLSEKNKYQLLIPRGFAHGFLGLEDHTIFSYKCDNYYNKDSERGIIYNDKTLNIDWGVPQKDLKLSEKDLLLGGFENAEI